MPSKEAVSAAMAVVVTSAAGMFVATLYGVIAGMVSFIGLLICYLEATRDSRE